VADHRKIREVPWPEGCIVVSVHRGNELLVASGDLELISRDALTVFGDEAARRRLIERLAPAPGDRTSQTGVTAEHVGMSELPL
jgi:Trk K+ transport system NAD-binding subunit